MNTPNLFQPMTKLVMRPQIGLVIILSALLTISCKKDKKDQLYDLETFTVKPSGSDKIKRKTDAQWATVLHANLFQKAISVPELYVIKTAIYSFGDKNLARELVISNFMQEQGAVIPQDTYMRTNMDAFLEETYKRFFIREISEAEKAWFKNYLTNNTDVTAEQVYFAFALSNEYQYY